MVLTGDELGMMEDALVAYNDLGCVLFQVFIGHSFCWQKCIILHLYFALFNISILPMHRRFVEGGSGGLPFLPKLWELLGAQPPFIEHMLSWIRS